MYISCSLCSATDPAPPINDLYQQLDLSSQHPDGNEEIQKDWERENHRGHPRAGAMEREALEREHLSSLLTKISQGRGEKKAVG